MYNQLISYITYAYQRKSSHAACRIQPLSIASCQCPWLRQGNAILLAGLHLDFPQTHKTFCQLPTLPESVCLGLSITQV